MRRMALLVTVFVFSVLSCGREITGPEDGLRVSYARGLSFEADFPEAVRRANALSSGVVDFQRVRVVFRRADGSVALDRVIDFPASSDSIEVALDVPLSQGTGPGGEVLALSLAYINAAGDTVFRGGPTDVTVLPTVQGSPPPAPFRVTVRYTGVGSTAAAVTILPETVTVTAGDPFAFTATARDLQQGVVSAAPVSWRSLDAPRAVITAPGAGAGTTGVSRGAARIVAELLSGGADTAIVNVLPRAGSLTVASGSGQSAPALTALAQPVQIVAMATDNLAMGGVPVAFTVAAGGGSVSVPNAVTDPAGASSFNWTLGPVAGTQTVRVSSAGIPDLFVNATATSAGPTQLVITQQPAAAQVAGVTITPSFVVEARDAGNALFPGFADSVFLTINANPGSDTVSGTRRIVAVGGVATFNAWHLRRAGAGYTVTASAAGLGSVTSSTFTVAAAAADTAWPVSGNAQTGTAGAPLPQPIVVRVDDAFGNPVAGQAVTFAVTVGSLSVTSVNTDAAGLASTAWTLGATPTVQTLTVTAGTLRGSPFNVTATVGAGIVTTTVTPTLDTLTAIGATRTLVPTSRDVGNAVVAGSYTWVSRDPAVATVGTTGLVTALTNGATWVVVTEAGGTRDSARVVVAQRLATIRVTPDPRDVYLGASYAFTAQAVDGLNVPLVTQPSFVWTTASSAIASITAGGIVTGVGLGSTLVQATASGVTGVATLNIRTPIQRIAVVRDSVGFVVSDTFSLAALAQTRSYRAVAYDTLDVVMPGIAFTWASSNPSVAPLDSTGSATARAIAAANGFTAIRASAQGVTGAAALTVAQVMTAVELTPTSASVAPTGSVVLTPRRRDANGFFIPGGSFTFASADPGIATVSAAGVVTGVVSGGTTVTATSGTVTSAPTAITVSFSVPPIISFGRDTIAVGRSATNVPIPVYLSRPDTMPITVQLAVADTFAFFNPVSVTIPTGSTVGTAILNGRNAGTTRVFAIDSRGAGFYAGDTATLAVQAGVRLTTTNYNLLVTDQLTTQVLLTDPAPAGGTFITYTFGTPGRISISPDPAFIPPGQLAANIVIQGLTAGSSTVTPVATGVNGTTSTVTTQAATLTMQRPWPVIGNGQYRDDYYVYTALALNAPLTITLTSSDTTVVTMPPSVTIPSGSNIAYFRVTTRGLGRSLLTTAATGWVADADSVVVSTPQLRLYSGGTLNTTSPAQALTVYAQDTVGGSHWRTSALAMQMTSSDTSVIRVQTPSPSIPAGQYYSSGVSVIPGGSAGTAWVHITASGHRPDSVQFTVVGPRLTLQPATARVGAGQFRPDGYVYTPNAVTAPLVIRLTSSDPAVATISDSVVINTGSNIAYYTLRGLTPGSVQLRATAVGYTDATPANFAVTPPKARIASGGGTFNNFSQPTTVTIYAADTLDGAHYATDSIFVSYTSSNPAVVTVTAADTIRPGQYYSQNARVSFIGTGSAWVRSSAPGHRPDSVLYTVVTPQLQFPSTVYRIGNRQFRTPTDFYVYTPNQRPDTVAVTITQTNAPIDSLTGTALRILPGSNIAYFGLAALGTGVDTLIATAAGYRPDTMVVVVTSPRLTGGTLPANLTTTSPPTTATIYVADSAGSIHYSLDTLLLAAQSSNDAVLQPDSVGFRLPRGTYFVQPRVRSVGPGTATMTWRDSLPSTANYGSITSNAVTVTGPSLTLRNDYPVLGMRQYRAGSGAYVTIPNAIASPLVVRLVSTDPLVATVPDSIVMPAGSTFAYVDIRARDQVGTVQIQATATGYGGSNATQQVTAPQFVLSVPTSVRTTQAPITVTVYPADATGNIHYVYDSLRVTLSSSNTGAATIDSAAVTILPGLYYNQQARVIPVNPGTTTITASDTRVESYRYNSASQAVAVVEPNLALSWGGALTLGVGQYTDQYVYTPDTRTSPLSVALAHLSASSSTPATVTIPTSTNLVYHRVTGAAAGADSITYTAAGHTTVRGAVTVDLGRVDGIGNWPANLTTDSVAVTLYARDQVTNVRNVAAATTFALTVNGSAFGLRQGGVAITSVTIPQDAQSVTFYIRRLANGTGNVTITNANYQTHITPTVTVTGAP